MKYLIIALLSTLCVSAAVDPLEHKKVICFWNSTSFERTGPGKFNIDDLRPALGHCTHLIYGFAGIDSSSGKVTTLNPTLDTGAGYGFYKLVIQLKKSFPHLKILLSIGGDADPYEDTHKYLKVTETPISRTRFVNSVIGLLYDYDFDGFDLAWQFPTKKIKTQKSLVGTIWSWTKKHLGYGKFQDDKETEHRDGFTQLAIDLKYQLTLKENKLLTLSVLPHINASVYYDIGKLASRVDFVNLLAFNQKTPERNEQEANYPAPIFESDGGVHEENVDDTVKYWLQNGCPPAKLVVGIPTFARTWKLTDYSQMNGEPPVLAGGPGAAGPHTQTPGLLSYPEICSRLTESAVGKLRHWHDSTSKKLGSFAFQPYDRQTDTEGIWVGYEDPESAQDKALYVKSKGLGGVAVFELSLDDFIGMCTGEKYPILKAAKSAL